jgi:hypothetical protein
MDFVGSAQDLGYQYHQIPKVITNMGMQKAVADLYYREIVTKSFYKA